MSSHLGRENPRGDDLGHQDFAGTGCVADGTPAGTSSAPRSRRSTAARCQPPRPGSLSFPRRVRRESVPFPCLSHHTSPAACHWCQTELLSTEIMGICCICIPRCFLDTLKNYFLLNNRVVWFIPLSGYQLIWILNTGKLVPCQSI